MRLNIIFCFLVLVALGLSCNNAVESNNQKHCFDQVDYYQLKDGIDLDELLVSDKDTLNETSQLLGDLAIGFVPQVISDTSFINTITDVGYDKINIPNEKLETIKDAFCFSDSHELKNRIQNKCINKYKDILILKYHGEIIGIVKLCFSCEDVLIVESEENTLNMNWDFPELKELLHSL